MRNAYFGGLGVGGILVLVAHCGSGDAGSPTDTKGDAGEPDAATSSADGEASVSTNMESGAESGAAPCVAVKAFQVSEEPGGSHGVSLAWNGSGYGIAWGDSRDASQQMYFARLDATGKKIGADVRVTDGMFDAGIVDGGPARFLSASSLVWTGTEYGLLWMSDGLWFEKLGADGKPTTTPVLVDPALDQNARQIAWNGKNYGVAWYDDHEGDFEVYFARLDAMGAKVGSDVRVTNSPGNSFTPALAAAGTNYGLAWHDNRADAGYHIFFSAVDSMGVETVDDVQVSTSSGGAARLAWTGDGYGVVWGNPNVTFARLDASGKVVGQETTLTTGATGIAISSTGQGFAVAQVVSAGVAGAPLSLALTDPNGMKLGSDIVLSNTSGGQTSIVGRAGGAAAAWIENKGDSTEVDFAIACP